MTNWVTNNRTDKWPLKSHAMLWCSVHECIHEWWSSNSRPVDVPSQLQHQKPHPWLTIGTPAASVAVKPLHDTPHLQDNSIHRTSCRTSAETKAVDAVFHTVSLTCPSSPTLLCINACHNIYPNNFSLLISWDHTVASILQSLSWPNKKVQIPDFF